MYVTSTTIVWSCSSRQPNLLLPLFLSFQPQAAEGDIFAAEDNKNKTKPKGTKKEKSKKPKGRSDEAKIWFVVPLWYYKSYLWRFLAAAKTKS